MKKSTKIKLNQHHNERTEDPNNLLNLSVLKMGRPELGTMKPILRGDE